MGSKILAIIVTYNPSVELLEKNINSILPQVDALFLFDNGSVNAQEIHEIQKRKHFKGVYNEENVGLGRAYNSILFGNLDQYDYFVTFDQDTSILPQTIDTLVNILEEHHNIGVIGPVFSRDTSVVNKKGDLVLKSAVIQSCAIFRSSVAREVGCFNEDYFIDSVDFEYCLRIRKKGFKVALFNGVQIQHNLGERKRSLGFNFFSHNKIRNYYIARNHMKITKQYFRDFPAFVIKKNIFFFLHITKVVFLERNRDKIQYLWKGITNQSL